VDGQALDEDDDALREMRLLWSLHGGWGFDVDVTPRQVLTIALERGRSVLGAPPGGRLEPGAAADLLILDRPALDDYPVGDVGPLDLLFSRGTRRHVKELIVAGRTIVRDGRVLGVDLETAHADLSEAYRAGISSRAGLLRALPALESAVRRYYAPRLGCC